MLLKDSWKVLRTPILPSSWPTLNTTLEKETTTFHVQSIQPLGELSVQLGNCSSGNLTPSRSWHHQWALPAARVYVLYKWCQLNTPFRHTRLCVCAEYRQRHSQLSTALVLLFYTTTWAKIFLRQIVYTVNALCTILRYTQPCFVIAELLHHMKKYAVQQHHDSNTCHGYLCFFVDTVVSAPSWNRPCPPDN